MLTTSQINSYIKNYPVNPGAHIDILMGPSWVGKTWIVKNVTDTHSFLVSTTTRPMREGEIDGKEYNFISKEQFESHLKNGEMINTFILHDEYYGYRGVDVDAVVDNGKTPLAIVYYKVLDSFIKKFPNLRLTFIFPPNTKKGTDFILDRIANRDKKVNKSRLADFYKQLKLMHEAQPSFLEKYPQGNLFMIEDNNSAKKIIAHLCHLERLL